MGKYKVAIIAILVIGLAGLAFWLSTNSANALDVDVSNVKKSITVKHFDDAFFTTDTLQFNANLRQLKLKYPPFFTQNNSNQFWYKMRTEDMQNALYSDLKKAIPDYKKLDNELMIAFKHLYYYYPDLPKFSVYTYVSRLDFETPILIADTLVFVASDLFLGKNHPAYDSQSQYLNYTKQPEFIIPEIATQLGYNLAKKDMSDQTLLNEMVWWGKIYYLNKALQPEVNDTIITRYSSKYYNFCVANEREIWTYFVDNQLIFDNSMDTKRRFVEPAPYSKFGMPFDNETPGMIGRWIGYQIVKSYMQANPNVSLPQLLAQKDSRLLFKNSKYKP